MSNQMNDDWWSLKQLGERWKTSPASLRRMAALPSTDPKHLKTMSLGKKQMRVHLSEILRHEESAKAVPSNRQEIIVKPSARKVTSLLQKRMESLARSREGARVAV